MLRFTTDDDPDAERNAFEYSYDGYAETCIQRSEVFLAAIDHGGAHARHLILSAGIGFCVVAPLAWNTQAWVSSLLGLPCAVVSNLVWTLCVSVGTLCFDRF